MESRITIKASKAEMNKFFIENSVCSVRYFEYIGKGTFQATIRHSTLEQPLCGIFTIPLIVEKLQANMRTQPRYPLKESYMTERDSKAVMAALELRKYCDGNDGCANCILNKAMNCIPAGGEMSLPCRFDLDDLERRLKEETGGNYYVFRL